MKEGARGFRLEIAGYETVMEGADMRAVVLTLDRGQCVPWHYHSTITDSFVCLKGPMVVETRAPRATHVLNAGERCASTTNRNFAGRQGRDSRTHLMSPAMAAAAAVAGRIVDIRDWESTRV